MANLNEMLGIMQTGGTALRQGLSEGMDRRRQSILDANELDRQKRLDEQNKKESDARLGLVDLQTKGVKRDLDQAMEGDTESKNLIGGIRETMQRDIEEFSKNVQTPEDEQILKQAKDNFRMVNAMSKYDENKAAKFAVGPFELKQQIESQKQKALRENEKFGLEKSKTEADIGATKALEKERMAGATKSYADAAKTKKETSLLGIPKPEDKKALFEMEQGLRKEYINGTKDFGEVQKAYKKVDFASKAKTAMGDHALIFAYMKTIDPGSTVREGEYATVEKARGVPESVINLFNKALDGQKLDDNQRNDIVSRTKEFFNVHKNSYESARKEYARIAKEQGLDISRVTPDVYGPDENNNINKSDDDKIKEVMGGGKSFTPSWKRTGATGGY